MFSFAAIVKLQTRLNYKNGINQEVIAPVCLADLNKHKFPAGTSCKTPGWSAITVPKKVK